MSRSWAHGAYTTPRFISTIVAALNSIARSIVLASKGMNIAGHIVLKANVRTLIYTEVNDNIYT